MDTPISILQNNICDHFENIRPETLEMLKKDVGDLKIDPGIEYDLEKIAIKNQYVKPYASLGRKKICIHEVFLSYLWSICYFFFVVNEHVQMKMIKNEWNGYLEFNESVLINALKLFKWAISLNDKYSEWDINLPNPQNPPSEEEKYICGKVNKIYLDAVVFILFHEYAHIVLDHKNKMNQIPQKELEVEADNYALESIILNSDDETYKLNTGVGLTIAVLSLFYLKNSLRNITSNTHPDLDIRVQSIIEYIHFSENESKFYLWYLVCTGYSIFFQNMDLGLEQIKVNNIDELLFVYKLYFQRIKENLHKPHNKSASVKLRKKYISE
jgi:hypothetical protein